MKRSVSVEKESQDKEHSITAVGKSSHKLCHSQKNQGSIDDFFPLIPKSTSSDSSSSLSDESQNEIQSIEDDG
ncbi:hypothetical protein ADUPG1_012393 [Aduncisulcus paluster]|uniref:Uncharacterized protein n=1 Tax=Aduncisulcus paluster TaxID=2918883 RepID=A0ABQ5JZA6_9EUKA|nr:hypothetical protein ADUPG1_012393 [Aduncisulcus paluster]